MIAVRNEVLENHPKVIQQILDIINTTTEEFKMIPSIDRTLASKYNQKVGSDSRVVKINTLVTKQMTASTFDKIMEQLLKLQIIDKKCLKNRYLNNSVFLSF